MKRIVSLFLALVMTVSLCAVPAWGAAVTAQGVVDTYLKTNGEWNITTSNSKLDSIDELIVFLNDFEAADKDGAVSTMAWDADGDIGMALVQVTDMAYFLRDYYMVNGTTPLPEAYRDHPSDDRAWITFCVEAIPRFERLSDEGNPWCDLYTDAMGDELDTITASATNLYRTLDDGGWGVEEFIGWHLNGEDGVNGNSLTLDDAMNISSGQSIYNGVLTDAQKAAVDAHITGNCDAEDFDDLLNKANVVFTNIDAENFIDNWLRTDKGEIVTRPRGMDGTLWNILLSIDNWNRLGPGAKELIDAELAKAQAGNSYELLYEQAIGFEFLITYLCIYDDNGTPDDPSDDYEGYMISTDPNGGTLTDPDNESIVLPIEKFDLLAAQSIVAGENSYTPLSEASKAFVKRMLTEKGFGLNHKATVPTADYPELLAAAKKLLESATPAQRAALFIDEYLRTDYKKGDIIPQVKGYNGSLMRVQDAELAWGDLSKEDQNAVNAALNKAHPGLNFDILVGQAHAYMFMFNYLLLVGEEVGRDYTGGEAYIISSDPNGGTLIDVDKTSAKYTVAPFDDLAKQKIIAGEEDYKNLTVIEKAQLKRLMTEEGFGLRYRVSPAKVNNAVADYPTLLALAKAGDTDQTLKDVVNEEATEAIKNAISADPDKTTISVEDAEGKTTIEFTEEGKEAFADADAADITTEVTDKTVDQSKISTDEKKDVANAAKEDGISVSGITLDIKVEVKVDGETVGNMTELPKAITVSILISDPATRNALKAPAGYYRTYWAFNYHNGEVEKLRATYDESTHTFYVESNKFSNFTIGYEETELPTTDTPSKNPNRGGGGKASPDVDAPYTFDAGIGAYAVTALLSVTGMAWCKKKDW